MALPEVAPRDIVGTPRYRQPNTLGPNNVKDGTPATRAHSLRVGGEISNLVSRISHLGGRAGRTKKARAEARAVMIEWFDF